MSDLAAVIRKFTEQQLGLLHVCVQARVVTYDRLTQRCSIDPQSFARVGQEEIALPRLEDVPVCWPRGGGFTITWPLAPGDIVTVQFSDRSLAAHRAAISGAAAAPSDPRAHHLSDAVVLPSGAWPDASPSPSTSPTDLVIARDGFGCIAIKPDGTVVLADVVGGATAQFLSTAPLVDAQLAALKTALLPFSAVPAVVTPVEVAAAVNVIITALKVLFGVGWPASTAALKTKGV